MDLPKRASIYLGACIPRKMKGSEVATLAAVSKTLWSPVSTWLIRENWKTKMEGVMVVFIIPRMQQWIGLRHEGLCCQTRLWKKERNQVITITILGRLKNTYSMKSLWFVPISEDLLVWKSPTWVVRSYEKGDTTWTPWIPSRALLDFVAVCRLIGSFAEPHNKANSLLYLLAVSCLVCSVMIKKKNINI